MGAGSSNAAVSDITLDELERLLKFLGMLGSAHDGEVVAAARFAAKWVAEKHTDWRTLLTPEPELGVSGVVAVADGEAATAEWEALVEQEARKAYQRGLADGMQAMAGQLKAQGAMQAGLGQGYGNPWMGHPAQNMGAQAPGAGLGAGLGGSWPPPPPTMGQAAQAAQAGSGAPLGRAWAPGTWQSVCQELLDRHGQGIPGVFQGAREETFVRDVLGRGFRTLTAAQEVWLRDIAGRSGMSW